MEFFILTSHLITLLALFIGGMAFLLINGLASRPSLLGRVSVWVGGMMCLSLASGGLIAATLGLPMGYWLPALVLAVLYFFLAILPSPAGRNLIARAGRYLETPRNRGMALLVSLGLACVFSIVITLNSLTDPPEHEFAEADLHLDEVNLVEVDSVSVFTDKGRPIVLKTSHAANAGHLDPDTLQRQFAMLSTHGLRDQVIHVPVGWQNCNCHGWVFTAGQFWVTSDQVDTILRDNQYRASTAPKPGDVAVYRTPEVGTVTHTGIVRYVSPTGDTILVESKWGRMGRFIHRHDTHCYGLDECTFYRSARSGHRLRGLPTDSAPPLFELEQVDSYRPMVTSTGVVRF